MTLRSIGGDSQVPLDHAAMLGLSEIVSALIDGGSQLRLPAAAAPGREDDVASPRRKMISPGLSSVFDDEVHVQPRAGLSCADSVQIILVSYGFKVAVQELYGRSLISDSD